MQVGEGNASSQTAHLRCNQSGVFPELLHASQMQLEEAMGSKSINFIRALNIHTTWQVVSYVVAAVALLACHTSQIAYDSDMQELCEATGGTSNARHVECEILKDAQQHAMTAQHINTGMCPPVNGAFENLQNFETKP